MYFSKFPQGLYDIKGDGNKKLVTDIMKRVKVRSKIADEISLYDVYDVPSGERPEDTAFKHFGDSELHWIILMTNNITDAYYGWPLSDLEFETYIIEKYSNPDAIHHYELTQSSGPQKGNGPDDYSHKIEVNSTEVGAQSVSNREYEQRLQDQKRQIKLLQPQFLGIVMQEFEKLISK
jgi:hypothetical protein|tara:strand:+ start:3165 stop:3698 length:534 start_codon:yes stop_codon:yes gene_type:complete